jgi:ATP/maltotriose-dependent transcriptional regulator MalT
VNLTLGELLVQRGEVEEGRAKMRESLAYAERAGNQHLIALALAALAEAARVSGDGAEEELRDEAIRVARRGQTLALPPLLEGRARLALERKDLDYAKRLYRESLMLSTERQRAASIGPSIAGLAAVAAERGQLERAGRLWGALDQVERLYGPAGDARRFYLSVVGRLDGDAAFAVAVKEGRAMTVAAALEYALSDA